ncbi:hypothetical protein C479_01656 [Halovivax asiaticus JCM 14624]|uniref:Uncharacterized protein n=1 Tax=Halovivax asiaticus JCM 14624 TaxID=1227490 RepID=M0BRG8_9EURY|nr:hypothetical protein [Halovivax asiaticus]ELZ13510.1 hypothetical protein C479_01656 [Halovivax asiaticus JCM 14624]
MRLELRVCEHCYTGEHGEAERQAIVQDMVRCAERIQEHKDVLDLDAVHIRKVREDETGKPEALPVVTASIVDDQVMINDTQLATEGDDGTMLVYPNPPDILTVLAKNIDEISTGLDRDVSVELSEAGSELLASKPATWGAPDDA